MVAQMVCWTGLPGFIPGFLVSIKKSDDTLNQYPLTKYRVK
jgi:hypothetical protein